MKIMCCLLAAALVLAITGGCSQVKDPWSAGRERLTAERTRSPEVAEILVHRLVMTQSDR